jgi:NitT/TauT family transport system permease protein
MKKLILKNLIQTGVAIVFLLIVWWIAYRSVGNDLLVPPLSDSLKEMLVLLGQGAFWRALVGSLSRALSAFALSFLLAVIFAVIAYLLPWFERFFAPLVSVLRSMPVLAVLLILLSFLNAGQAPIAVAFLSLYPMLYAGFLAALCQVDKDLIKMSRVYNVPLKRRILSLYLPSAAPYAMRESAAALAFSLKLVVSAEVLASTYKSLGGLMQEARLFLEMPTLFALVSITFFVGLILETAGNILAEFVERRVK